MQPNENEGNHPEQGADTTPVTPDAQAIEPIPTEPKAESETSNPAPEAPVAKVAQRENLLLNLRWWIKTSNVIIAVATVANVIIVSYQSCALSDANREAKRAADAAEDQIKMAKESVRREQRAHVYVTAFAINREPTVTDPNIVVTIVLANTGRTSAHRMTNRARLGYDRTEQPLPVWIEIQASAPAVLHPAVTGNAVHFDFSEYLADATKRAQLAKAVEGYRFKKLNLFIRARIEYLDWYDAPHWVEVCAYHPFGVPLNTFVFCNSGNDFDREKY